MLKPCPCGKIPNKLCIHSDGGVKWAYVSGDCCDEWNIEFRTQYYEFNTEECMNLAVKAWNDAPRK